MVAYVEYIADRIVEKSGIEVKIRKIEYLRQYLQDSNNAEFDKVQS